MVKTPNRTGPMTLVAATKLGRERVAQDATAARMGFTFRPPVYMLGAVVNERSDKLLTIARDKHENMPLARTGLRAFAWRIGQEKRTDHIVKVRELSMHPHGELQRMFAGTMQASRAMSERAFMALCAFITPGGAHYLAECPPALRAQNFNYWAPLADEDREVMLRIRLAGDGQEREIWGVVGPRYTIIDANVIAALVAECVPDDARVEVTYDGGRSCLNVEWPTDVIVADDVFKLGASIRFADDGSDSIQIRAYVKHAQSCNIITVQAPDQRASWRRHQGSPDKIVGDIRNGIARAFTHADTFTQAWQAATTETVTNMFGTENMVAVFKAMVAKDVVVAVGVQDEELVERLVRAYNAAPSPTKAGILNAVAHMAHTEAWKPWVTQELEERAGALLFSANWHVSRADVQRQLAI